MAAPFLTGFTLSLSLIVAIGAQNAFVLRQGLRREHLGVVVAVCALLDVLLMAAGVFGLGALVGASPRVLGAITLAGAAVLVFYGVQALRRALAPGHLLAGPGVAGMPRARALREVLAISLLNPHVYLDTVVLVGAVGAIGQSNVKRLLAYSSINNVGFMLIGLAAASSAGLREWPSQSRLRVPMPCSAEMEPPKSRTTP